MAGRIGGAGNEEDEGGEPPEVAAAPSAGPSPATSETEQKDAPGEHLDGALKPGG
jgi:hypothetical protein